MSVMWAVTGHEKRWPVLQGWWLGLRGAV